MQNRVEENTYRPWRGVALVAGVALVVMVVFGQLLQVGQASAVQPELAVAKTVAQPQSPAGSTLDYTVVITNSGTSEASITMRDELPAEVSYVDGSFYSSRGGSPIIEGQVITWTGPLNNNDQVIFTFQAYLTDTADSGTTITNTAIVSGTNGLMVDTAVTEIVTLPDLSGEKAVSQAEAVGGDTLTYTITVNNSGGVAANNVGITDTLPAQLTYVSGSATASSGDVTADANTVYWQGDVDAMAQVEVSFAALLGSPLPVDSVVTNTAHLDYEGMIWALTAATTITDSGLINLYLPLIYKAIPVPVLTASPVNQANNSWTLSWSEAAAGVTGFELQESQTADFNEYDTFTFDSDTTSYDVQRPVTASGRYYYRIRALSGSQSSPWSATLMVQGVTFTIELSATRPNSANAWTVNWTVTGTPANFELQEAKNPDFQGATTLNLPGGTLSRAFNHSASFDNVYYYRIRAVDSTGATGNWSNVERVVGAYYDDFTNDSSGWGLRRTTYLEKSIFWYGTGNEAGNLVVIMDDAWDWMIVSPLRPAPELPYAIEYRKRVHDGANLVSGGLALGGDWNGEPCVDYSSYEGVYQHTNCFNQFYNFNYIHHGPMSLLYERIDELVWCPECGGSPMKRLGHVEFMGDIHPDGPSREWHTYRVEVREDGLRLYINGALRHTFAHPHYVHQPYFGAFVSADEYKPSIFLYDYFTVTPLDE